MLEMEVAPNVRDVRDARVAFYFRSAFRRGATLLLGFFVLVTTIELIRGDFLVARPNFGFIFVLTLLPILIGFFGLNTPAVKRYTEAPVTYRFSDDGVEVLMRRGQASLQWSEISRATETGRHFVMLGGGALQILPKRDITSENQAALRHFLSAKLGRRARIAIG
jgi:hypothetical protein